MVMLSSLLNTLASVAAAASSTTVMVGVSGFWVSM